MGVSQRLLRDWVSRTGEILLQTRRHDQVIDRAPIVVKDANSDLGVLTDFPVAMDIRERWLALCRLAQIGPERVVGDDHAVGRQISLDPADRGVAGLA